MEIVSFERIFVNSVGTLGKTIGGSSEVGTAARGCSRKHPAPCFREVTAGPASELGAAATASGRENTLDNIASVPTIGPPNELPHWLADAERLFALGLYLRSSNASSSSGHFRLEVAAPVRRAAARSHWTAGEVTAGSVRSRFARFVAGAAYSMGFAFLGSGGADAIAAKPLPVEDHPRHPSPRTVARRCVGAPRAERCCCGRALAAPPTDCARSLRTVDPRGVLDDGGRTIELFVALGGADRGPLAWPRSQEKAAHQHRYAREVDERCAEAGTSGANFIEARLFLRNPIFWGGH